MWAGRATGAITPGKKRTEMEKSTGGRGGREGIAQSDRKVGRKKEN